MAYIYKKIINNKPYYYLRISKRINNKVVTKDIAYLGNDAAKISKKLDGLSQFKKEIRTGYKAIKRFLDSAHYFEKAEKIKKDDFLDYDILKKVEAIKLHFNERFLKQKQKTIEETYKSFLIEFAFNTTSIEGNTITLAEAAKLLMEDLTPKERSSREVFDLQNTEKVFFELIKEKPEFNQELIIKVHDELIKNIDERMGYRKHEIKVFKSRFDTSPVKYISTDMNLLLNWYEKLKNKLHPIVLVSLFHQKFEKIHPFANGNGRTGRMILNYLLISMGYPPLIVQKKRRKDYLSALSRADNAGLNNIERKKYALLVNYLAEELISFYWDIFNI